MVMHSGLSEEQKKRIDANRARDLALYASMPGCVSDDDEDAIWRHGRHEDVELPCVADLPKLPEPMQSVRGQKDDNLEAHDILQAVAHWLYGYCGSVVWGIHVDVKPTPMEEPVATESQGIAAPSPSCDYRPSTGDAGKAMLDTSSPRPSPKKRYRCKDPELLESVTSGRVSGKQSDPRPTIVKRNAKLCQAADCKFSTGQPGQPARAEGATFCMWCEPGAIKTTLESKAGRAKVTKALTLFRGHAVAHRAALELLPDDFPDDVPTGDTRYCTSSDCVFNRERPGHPARRSVAGEELCMWCDPVLLRKRCAADEGLKQVRKSISMFKAENEMVYRRAVSLLPDGYCHTQGPLPNLNNCVFCLTLCNM